MLVEEVMAAQHIEAEQKEIEGQIFYTDNVKQQKSQKIGDAAPVTFSEQEYKALNLFVGHLRVVITNDRFSGYAFPSKLTAKGK